jgi:hypothetical protein
MAKTELRDGAEDRRFSADCLYAWGVLVWIGAVWGVAFYAAGEAIADESAGVGGNSFLLASSLAAAGLVTALSIREFLAAYRRCRRGRG